jgi:hypothetical protein
LFKRPQIVTSGVIHRLFRERAKVVLSHLLSRGGWQPVNEHDVAWKFVVREALAAVIE